MGFDKKSSRDLVYDRGQAIQDILPQNSPTTESAHSSPSTPLTLKNLRIWDATPQRTPQKDQSRAGDPMRKRGAPRKQDKKKVKRDPDSHPLNLPPDELRRLSAAMAKEEASRQSTDTEDNADDQNDNMEWKATTPFDEPPQPNQEVSNGIPNGVNGHAERSPTPPPHQPPPKPPIDPEACKAAGNKFFRAKDYFKAIDEYSKGLFNTSDCMCIY